MPSFQDLLKQYQPIFIAQNVRIRKTILSLRPGSLGEGLTACERDVENYTQALHAKGYTTEPPYTTEEELWGGIHLFLDCLDEFKKNSNMIELTDANRAKINQYCDELLIMFESFVFITKDDKSSFYAERILRKVTALQERLVAEPSIDLQLKYLAEIERWCAILEGQQADKHAEILQKGARKYFLGLSDRRIRRMRQEAQAISFSASEHVSRSMNVDTDTFISTPASLADELIHQTPFDAGTCDLMGRRKEQEDTLVVSRLRGSDLADLSAQDIGHRLWTALKEIDDQVIKDPSLDNQGATASTTIVRGDDIITATIGDSVSFAMIYDVVGQPFVFRLNHRIHSADEPTELARLKASEYEEPLQCDQFGATYSLSETVSIETEVRLKSGINMSRSVGDNDSRPYGAVSDADIDVHSLSQLKDKAKVRPGFMGEVSKIQIMSACDGFTAIADQFSKKKDGQFLKTKQEEFLEYCLNFDPSSKAVSVSESLLAKRCANLCLEPPHEIEKNERGYYKYLEKWRVNGSTVKSSDNISVVIQTLPLEQSSALPFSVMLGVYDGHGGNQVSRLLAANIHTKFTHQCALSPEQYASQSLSVYRRLDDYTRDNGQLTREELKKLQNAVRQMVDKLNAMRAILKSPDPLPDDFDYSKRMEECQSLLREIKGLKDYFSEVPRVKETMDKGVFETVLTIDIPRLMRERVALSSPIVDAASSPLRPEREGVRGGSIFRGPVIDKRELHEKIGSLIDKVTTAVLNDMMIVTRVKHPTSEQIQAEKIAKEIKVQLSILKLNLTKQYIKKGMGIEEYCAEVMKLIQPLNDNEDVRLQKLWGKIRELCRNAGLAADSSSSMRPSP